MELYPLKFEPIYKEKIWGGRSLETLFGRALPAGVKIGESWELADLAEGVSCVSNGPLAGMSLTQLTADYGEKLLGSAKPTDDGRFPLLLKLLDANDILSMQVHPDADAVAAIGGDSALKTECWYALDSRDGYIYKGVMPGVTAEQFRSGIESGSEADLVRRIDVSAGDFHFLPAGTIHALGAGVLVAEVQTPSDTTYRVSDWGRGREIHVERSIQCIHYEEASDTPPGASGDTLLVTEFFTVEKLTCSGDDCPILASDSRCTALMFVSGSGPIRIGGGPTSVDASPGDTVLLPAALGEVTVSAGVDCEFLRITLPE